MIERTLASELIPASASSGDAVVRSWYLVHTKPARESIARANLIRQDYEVYLPRVLEPVRRSGRWRDRIAALFPRYLFLRLNEGRQSLGPARSSVGVAAIVRFGFNYAVVPDPIVTSLQAREDPATGLHRLAHRAALIPGESVGIHAGPFDGLQGIFDRQAGAERVIVLLRLLGHEISVQVPAQFVQSGRAA
jgi:transcriptional antiterminator RfaH